MNDASIREHIDGLPNLLGSEDLIAEAMAGSGEIFLPESSIDFGRSKSAFPIALRMHQPLIPAGGKDLRTAGRMVRGARTKQCRVRHGTTRRAAMKPSSAAPTPRRAPAHAQLRAFGTGATEDTRT